MTRKKVTVVDGQGGGVGKALIEKLRQAYGASIRVVAVGTNALATTAMLKAGADAAATGENAVRVNVARTDAVLGALGIVAADSMMGEITPAMARDIAQCAAPKILVPIHRCALTVVGVRERPFAEYIAEAVEAARPLLCPGDAEADASRRTTDC